jgi:O-antigen ligase/tetratricopeptide (TPR) repeat protein
MGGNGLGRLGHVRVLAIGALLWLMPAAMAQVELPRAAVALIGPGLASAQPGAPTLHLALVPEYAITQAATAGLWIGAGAVAMAISSLRRLRAMTPTLLIYTLALVLAFGWLHLGLEQEAVLGRYPKQAELRQGFFAPLVNSNHTGTLIVLALPACLAAWSAASTATRWTARGVTLVGALTLVWINSAGAFAAAALVVMLSRPPRIGGFLAGIGGLAGLGALLAGDSNDVSSFASREQIWRAGFRTVGDHLWFGVGPGGFEPGVSAYRGDMWFRNLGHAHSDPLERLIETGLVGAALSLAAVMLLVRALRRSAFTHPLMIGVVGVMAHTLVEFPLQVPAVAMLVAFVVGTRLPSSRIRPRWARAFLVILALLQWPAAAWQIGVSERDTAHAQLVKAGHKAASTTAQQAAVLTAGPHRHWRVVHQAWLLEAEGDADGAARAAKQAAESSADPAILRACANILARSRRWSGAETMLHRAQARSPWDFRNQATLARYHTHQGQPEAAVEAWLRAFEMDAPLSLVAEAYDALPVGLVWLPVVERISQSYMRQLGKVLLQRGDVEMSLMVFDAARLQDDYAGPYYWHGRALLRAGRPEDARALAMQMLTKDTQHAQAHWVLGHAATAVADHAAAEVHYRDASELEPDYRFSILQALAAQHGIEPALAQAANWRLAGLENDRAELEVGHLYASVGRWRECLDHLETTGLAERGKWSALATELERECRAASR